MCFSSLTNDRSFTLAPTIPLPKFAPSPCLALCLYPSVIIFDWDDTLLPTSSLVRSGQSLATSDPIPAPLATALAALETVVCRLLARATALAQVYIVTNAQHGWVQLSAHRFLPAVVPYLARTTIFSARAAYEHMFPNCPIRWKIYGFRECAFHAARSHPAMTQQERGNAGSRRASSSSASDCSSSASSSARDYRNGGGKSGTDSSSKVERLMSKVYALEMRGVGTQKDSRLFYDGNTTVSRVTASSSNDESIAAERFYERADLETLRMMRSTSNSNKNNNNNNDNNSGNAAKTAKSSRAEAGAAPLAVNSDTDSDSDNSDNYTAQNASIIAAAAAARTSASTSPALALQHSGAGDAANGGVSDATASATAVATVRSASARARLSITAANAHRLHAAAAATAAAAAAATADATDTAFEGDGVCAVDWVTYSCRCGWSGANELSAVNPSHIAAATAAASRCLASADTVSSSATLGPTQDCCGTTSDAKAAAATSSLRSVHTNNNSLSFAEWLQRRTQQQQLLLHQRLQQQQQQQQQLQARQLRQQLRLHSYCLACEPIEQQQHQPIALHDEQLQLQQQLQQRRQPLQHRCQQRLLCPFQHRLRQSQQHSWPRLPSQQQHDQNHADLCSDTDTDYGSGVESTDDDDDDGNACASNKGTSARNTGRQQQPPRRRPSETVTASFSVSVTIPNGDESGDSEDEGEREHDRRQRRRHRRIIRHEQRKLQGDWTCTQKQWLAECEQALQELQQRQQQLQQLRVAQQQQQQQHAQQSSSASVSASASASSSYSSAHGCSTASAQQSRSQSCSQSPAQSSSQAQAPPRPHGPKHYLREEYWYARELVFASYFPQQVISIGDSLHERSALMRLQKLLPQGVLMKSLKLVERPTVLVLLMQLESVDDMLDEVFYAQDFLDMQLNLPSVAIDHGVGSTRVNNSSCGSATTPSSWTISSSA